MKKFIAALTFFIGLSVQASLLSVLVTDTDVTEGGSFDVTVAASMTEDFNFLSFQLDFDTSLFDVVSGSFSSAFTGLVSDPGFLTTSFTPTGFAFDFNDFFALDLPAGEYEAAKFSLTAKAASTAPATFAFADGIFAPVAGNAAFDEVLISPDPQKGETSVTVSSVAAPSSLALMGLAGLALVGFRRRA